MFASAGMFYEFEKWEDPTPNAVPITVLQSQHKKSHLSVSFKQHLGEHWELTTTAIHQAKPDSYFKEARFGGAADLKYNITPNIGIKWCLPRYLRHSPNCSYQEDLHNRRGGAQCIILSSTTVINQQEGNTFLHLFLL